MIISLNHPDFRTKECGKKQLCQLDSEARQNIGIRRPGKNPRDVGKTAEGMRIRQNTH